MEFPVGFSSENCRGIILVASMLELELLDSTWYDCLILG